MDVEGKERPMAASQRSMPQAAGLAPTTLESCRPMSVFLIARRLLNRVRDEHIAALLAAAVTIVIVGGLVFAVTDHESAGAGIYWAITTATTVGYGDVIPHNAASRVVAVVVMLTTIPLVGSALALFAGTTVIKHLRRMLGLDTRLPPSPYTLVFGAHPVVAPVLLELVEADDTVVLVGSKKPAGLHDKIHFLTGDPTDEEVMRTSRPDQADRALIACEDDADTLIVAVALRTSAPDLEIYALTESARVAKALRDLGVSRTLSSTHLVGHTVAKSLETPSAGDVIRQLVGSDDYELRERVVDAELASHSLSQARAATGALVLGIAKDGKVDLGIDEDPTLGPGDRLVELVRAPPRRNV
jgi:voltage-gated potassium channel